MTTEITHQSNERLAAALEQLLALVAPPATAIDWQTIPAARWRMRTASLLSASNGYLQAIPQVAPIRLADIQHVDTQKMRLVGNTAQFVAGKPANNILLTGAKGTGKSSLIKACLNEFFVQGLRVIEVDKTDLVCLPDIVEQIAAQPYRFILFCDDLSFDEGDSGYKALKTVLDGALAAPAENVLVYATSNRRHLLPEYFHENKTYTHTDDGEIHPGEVVEEKISLSERFGLWISFQPFRQDDYLNIVAHWLVQLGCATDEIERARADALRFAIERGSRSGRVAYQFAKDWAGKV
ncbi:ATP-binding protein [Parvibium lacunae]|uniref:ATP-binding protein n=1 Tax=Parvibium lacunae TaxID=1888893 RepID=A0A368L1V8_9BURK|nr:ATP-binding protein [Parvibium lacunae]RCS57546.1 ATP-binding protein [Parvibium lacunae]